MPAAGSYSGSKALPCIQLLLQAGQYKSVGSKQSSKWSISCRQSSKGRSAADKAARVGQLQAGQQGSIVIAVRDELNDIGMNE